MGRTAVVVGIAAIAQGLIFAYLGSVWWIVNGIAAIDTVDGRPPGPLHGYGITAVLLLTGIAMFTAGGQAVRRASRWRLTSMALIAVVNAGVAGVGVVAVVFVERAADRGVAIVVTLVAAALALTALRTRELMAQQPTSRPFPTLRHS